MYKILWSLFLLVSCGNPTLETSKETPKPVAPKVSTTEQASAKKIFFEMKLEALPKANQYRVHLNWSKANAPQEGWILMKNKSVIGQWSIDTAEFIDDQVQPKGTYTYMLYAVAGEKREEYGRTKVTIPNDLEIKKPLKMTGVHHFGRVFLKQGAVLSVEDKNLELHADHLISDGALLQFFGRDFPFEDNGGRSAGIIKIYLKEASGELNVLNQGQPGGLGQVGISGPPGAPGTKGSDSVVATRTIAKQIWTGNSPLREQLRYVDVQEVYCQSPPTNGSSGGVGGPGGKGLPGIAGGNGGHILIQIAKNPEEFILNSNVTEALGGPGGFGGVGGPGGAMGLAGVQIPPCPAASNGSPGVSGPQGSRGEPGANGGKGTICTRFEKVEGGDCSYFQEEERRKQFEK